MLGVRSPPLSAGDGPALLTRRTARTLVLLRSDRRRGAGRGIAAAVAFGCGLVLAVALITTGQGAARPLGLAMMDGNSVHASAAAAPARRRSGQGARRTAPAAARGAPHPPLQPTGSRSPLDAC